MARDVSSWRAYVRGRAAINADQLGEAARQFRIALDASARNRMLMQRTFGLALLSGNEKLSEELARQLDALGEDGFDTRLVLLASAVKKGDWAKAKAIRNILSNENRFLFALPVIDAWLALGSGGDALAPIGMTGRDPLAKNYADEHRAFLLGAMGRTEDSYTAFQPLIAGESGRAVRLRLAAAAMLQKEGQKKRALALLAVDNPTAKAAAKMIENGQRLPTGIFTPAEGIGELLARLAADVSRDQVTGLSLALGRAATFLAPGNAESWLVAANMLAEDDKPEAALEALSHISLDDPFALQGTTFRIVLLQRLNRKEEALAVAQAAATSTGAGAAEWAQLGDALVTLDRQQDATNAYTRALAATPSDGKPWSLYLLRGGAYERSGDWKRAEPDLRRAVELAPDRAVALNYLGYALLDRNLKTDEAQKLIEQASALQPQDGAITDSLGWVYYRRGDYRKAIELLERAVKLEPAEPTINEHLGDSYWQVGRHLEARYSWRAAMVGTDDRPVLDRLKRKLDFGLED